MNEQRSYTTMLTLLQEILALYYTVSMNLDKVAGRSTIEVSVPQSKIKPYTNITEHFVSNNIPRADAVSFSSTGNVLLYWYGELPVTTEPLPETQPVDQVTENIENIMSNALLYDCFYNKNNDKVVLESRDKGELHGKQFPDQYVVRVFDTTLRYSVNKHGVCADDHNKSIVRRILYLKK